MKKAIGLLSGGLDSTLACAIIKQQGFEVIGLYFYTGFCITSYNSAVRKSHKDYANPGLKMGAMLNIKTKIIDISKEYFDILLKPKYGYGKNINPCIDCRIYMLKKAKEIMEQENALFVFTGEVLGQRPMTGSKITMELIERKSGLKGYLIRPLSALLFEQSIPEKENIVDRTQFYDIQGRSRKRQIELAKKFGIKEYYQPAGGCCFLTDKNYARRAKDLFKYKKTLSKIDFELLMSGRHIRINESLKLILGRNEQENNFLLRLNKNLPVVYPVSAKGPIGIIDITKDKIDEKEIEEILLNIARYCKGDFPLKFIIEQKGEKKSFYINRRKERTITI